MHTVPAPRTGNVSQEQELIYPRDWSGTSVGFSYTMQPTKNIRPGYDKQVVDHRNEQVSQEIKPEQTTFKRVRKRNAVTYILYNPILYMTLYNPR